MAIFNSYVSLPEGNPQIMIVSILDISSGKMMKGRDTWFSDPILRMLRMLRYPMVK